MINGKIGPVFEKWKDRNLSMSGKTTVLRTMILSKIWHYAKMNGLQKKFVNSLYSKMLSFFWHPRTFHCINVKVLQNDPKKGGINFPNIESETEAYFLENISIALNHPEKQWVGMLVL